MDSGLKTDLNIFTTGPLWHLLSASGGGNSFRSLHEIGGWVFMSKEGVNKATEDRN